MGCSVFRHQCQVCRLRSKSRAHFTVFNAHREAWCAQPSSRCLGHAIDQSNVASCAKGKPRSRQTQCLGSRGPPCEGTCPAGQRPCRLGFRKIATSGPFSLATRRAPSGRDVFAPCKSLSKFSHVVFLHAQGVKLACVHTRLCRNSNQGSGSPSKRELQLGPKRFAACLVF
jgi:hypothetical protein